MKPKKGTCQKAKCERFVKADLRGLDIYRVASGVYRIKEGVKK